MNTAVAVDRIAETSPRFKARIAGFFYLLMFPLDRPDIMTLGVKT
jgi:hypothetical protein